MKIKYGKFSLDITTKDLDWFNKLSHLDQLTILALLIGGAYTLNKATMSWYLTIKEENRKDRLINDQLKIKAKKVEIKAGGSHE